MKKTNKFLKKLAVITLSSVAALQNICANTEINIDQNTITVNFDASNPQKATVALNSNTKTVNGIPDGIFYLYPLDPYNFICCNPQLNTYDILSTNFPINNQIYDFGNGITFWRSNWTGYYYFIDNGRIILPLVVPDCSRSGACKLQYNTFYGPSYAICFNNGIFYEPKILNPYAQQININYTPAQSNNNNLNNFNYNRPLVIDSNEPQNLFHQTQTTVSPTQAITGNPGAPSDESLHKPPKERGRPTIKHTLKKPTTPSNDKRTVTIGPYLFPETAKQITDVKEFITIQPTYKNPDKGKQATYRTLNFTQHKICYKNPCGYTAKSVTFRSIGGVLGWKLARAAVLSGHQVPTPQQTINGEGWDQYANPTKTSQLCAHLTGLGLWNESMRLDGLPANLAYADDSEFADIDKRIFCEMRQRGVPTEWKRNTENETQTTPHQDKNNLNNFNDNQPLVIDSNESQNLFHQTQTTVSPTQAITDNPGKPSEESLIKAPKTPGETNTKGFGKKRVTTMPDWTATYTMPDVFLKTPKAVWLLRCQTCAKRNKKQPCDCVDGNDFTPHRLNITVGLSQEYRFVCCHCEKHKQQTEKTFRDEQEMLDELAKKQEIFYYCRKCNHIQNPERLKIGRTNKGKISVRCGNYRKHPKPETQPEVITMPEWTKNYTMPDKFLSNNHITWLLHCPKCAESKGKQPCDCVDGNDSTPHALAYEQWAKEKYRFICKHCERHGRRTENKFKDNAALLAALEQGQEIFYYCRNCKHIKHPARLLRTCNYKTGVLKVTCREKHTHKKT